MSVKKEPSKVIRIPVRFESQVKAYIQELLLNAPEPTPEPLNAPEPTPEPLNAPEPTPEPSRAFLDLTYLKSLAQVDLSSAHSRKRAYVDGITIDKPVSKKTKRKNKKKKK